MHVQQQLARCQDIGVEVRVDKNVLELLTKIEIFNMRSSRWKEKSGGQGWNLEEC